MISPNCVMVSSYKQTLASMASRYTDLESICVSFLIKRNIVLIWTGKPMNLYIFCLFHSRSSLMDTCLNCSKYSSISYLTWFLHLISVSEPTDSITCGFTKKSRLLYKHAYEAWVLAMNEVSCLLFWMSIWTFAFSNFSSFPIQAVPLCIALTIHAW